MKVFIGKDLKSVVEEMGLQYRWCFRDSYKTKDSNIKKASIKFVGLYLSEEQKKELIERMESKGYKFEFFKETYPSDPTSEYNNKGTRICFSKVI